MMFEDEVEQAHHDVNLLKNDFGIILLYFPPAGKLGSPGLLK